MCGIAGFFRPGPLEPDAPRLAQSMGDALRHRGPDDRGEWLDGEAGIALAHRRLAILDLSAAGAQPMCSADGRWVVAYNGEIYNHLVLRSELEATGRAPAWRGHSDTETLLAAISAWGLRQALEKSVGMFALALWDRDARTLTLARDRLGEKPLYYGVHRGTLLFGSELAALHRHPRFEDEIDRGALALLLRYGYVPAPWSIHASVRKLPPGCLLTMRTPADATAAPVPYWSALAHALEGQRDPLALSDDEAVDELERLLRQSLQGQRVADVPIGAFLSGGIDSSLVVAVMQSLSGGGVRTFTAGFDDPAHDESVHARAVAAHLGTRHTEFRLTEPEALATVRELPRLFSEPLGDASQIPTHLVCRLARSAVTVAISGDGGDELFWGYERYRWAGRIASVPSWLRRAGAALMRPLPATTWAATLAPVERWLPAELRGPMRADRLRKLLEVVSASDDDAVYRLVLSPWPADCRLVRRPAERPSVLDAEAPALRSLDERMMLLDLRSYLPDDVLTKVDRAAMAASLETRVPLLDHRIVEFALRLPMHQKRRDGRSKWLLRRLLDRHVPRHLIDRPKMGFGIPIHDWLRGGLRDWAESLLAEDRLRAAGLVDPAPIRRTWAEHLAGTHDWGYRLWPLLVFEGWRDHRAGSTHAARSEQ
jgi:asparagine synthase (glutamine-hydrolysing)